MINIIDLQQGSEQWLEYRRSHANSSEAACIMGCARFEPDSWLKLWREKTGRGKPIFQNAAMRAGIEREPLVRALVCSTTGVPYLSAVIESGWLSASLDGLSEDSILEIKCPSGLDSPAWVAACSGNIEPHYMAQVQHALMVSGKPLCQFVVAHPKNNDYIRIEIASDPEYQKLLMEQWRAFWRHIEEFTPPEPSERDIMPMSGEAWEKAAQAWRIARSNLELAQQAADYAKRNLEAMCAMCDHDICQGGGVRVQRKFRKGNVDYSKIPQLKGVDLEPYRKKGTSYVEVREIDG